jgi:hypothetical protein
MQRSGIRERDARFPDSIAFHPGYDVSSQINAAMAEQKTYLRT